MRNMTLREDFMKPEAITTSLGEADHVEVEVTDLDLREDLFNLCLPCCGPSIPE